MHSEETTTQLDRLLARHRAAVDSAVERLGTPLHVLFLEVMRENAVGFLDVAHALYPNTVIAFAAKSNPCRGALRAAHHLGLGADVASEFELRAALEESIDPDRITCNGNAKSDAYIEAALRAGALVAVDNTDELARLETLADDAVSRPRILLRFRGMPLSGLTSDDQTTASDWTKFGFHIDDAPDLFGRIASSRTVRFVGISAHIGTQIADPVGYERLISQFVELAAAAARAGLTIEAIDIGGGFPVRFLPKDAWDRFTSRLLSRVQGESGVDQAVTWNDVAMGYASTKSDRSVPPQWIGKSYWTPAPGSEMLAHLLRHRLPDGRTTVEWLGAVGSPRLIVEPGRSLLATAGVTLTRAMGVKRVLGHSVVALDLGINNHGTNLISPDIFPAAVLPKRDGDRPIEAFLAGRLCFSGDMISKAKVRLNRTPRRGEPFVLYHTGAYGADHFASHSCGFPRPAKVAIRGDGTVEVWRAPESFEDLFGLREALLLLDGLRDGGRRGSS